MIGQGRLFLRSTPPFRLKAWTKRVAARRSLEARARVLGQEPGDPFDPDPTLPIVLPQGAPDLTLEAPDLTLEALTWRASIFSQHCVESERLRT